MHNPWQWGDQWWQTGAQKAGWSNKYRWNKQRWWRNRRDRIQESFNRLHRITWQELQSRQHPKRPSWFTTKEHIQSKYPFIYIDHYLMKIFPNLYQILHHPVMIMFIERRWMKTKWLFLISFLLYLLFLILLSTFFGLMYFREGAKPAQTLTFEDAARECKGIMQRIGKSSYSLQCQALHWSWSQNNPRLKSSLKVSLKVILNAKFIGKWLKVRQYWLGV